MSAPIDPYRLPTSIVPEHYRIHLDPNLVDGTFSGSVTIDAVASESVSEVMLNSDELEIISAMVNGEVVASSTDTENERLILDVAVAAGPLEITIEFRGAFNDQLVGFYLSRFDVDGEDRVLATTQFEATHARKCFPCWDEPAFKATFAIDIVAPEGMNAVANSQETARQPHEGGGELISFAPTMKMSTYLVAFVVGPLEITEPIDVDGTPLRIVHPPGAGGVDGALTKFGLECGEFGLRYFTEYFGIPYPGDKVDLVAIPDFAFGAMENLGCITFRETLLLIDPSSATQVELQRAADVIFHELAHMWFGDLVTMSWWNGLWLNEAFATFMEMRCTDAFRPHWQRWTDFGVSRTAAFDTDALASTRPIEFEVTSPEDAEGMFDILTYEKGAAVVRMLEQHLGEDPFRSGIRRYMTENAYGNAETTDLWDAIEAETGEPVRRIMDSWIFQGGYPLVSATLSEDRSSVTLSQERMAFEGGDEAPDQLWAVPIRYRWQPVGGDPMTGSLLLDGHTQVVELGGEADWFVANADGASFIRVAYDDETMDQLSFIAHERLSAIERYALVDDSWAAVTAGRTSSLTFLSLIESLTAEHDRSVWARMIAGLGSLRRLLGGEALLPFEEIAHDAIAPALAGLTLAPLDDDDDRTRQLRGDLIRAMGLIANDAEIQEEAKRTVAVARREPESLDASIIAAAVEVTAAIGDDADADDFLELSESASTPQEQLRYLHALADFPDDHNLAKVRARILSGDVRSQNAPFWLRRALTNRENGRATWNFIQEHWDQLSELFPSSSIVRMVEGITTLTEPGDAEQAASFFADHPVPQGEKTLSQILERQRVAIALRGREADRLNNFLAP